MAKSSMNDSNGKDGKKRLRLADNSSLPEVKSSITGSKEKLYVIQLLEEARRLTVKKNQAEERLKSIKTELCAFAAADELSGFRNGKIGFEYRGEVTRSSLSRVLLLENGVDPDIIEASYDKSAPYVDSRIVLFD